MTKSKSLNIDSELTVSSAACSELFSIKQTTLRSWKSKGCPSVGHNQWDLRQVIDWWQSNLMESKAEEIDKGLSVIKKSYWMAKTRVEEVKAANLEERYLPKEELASEWVSRALIYRAGLLAFASRLPPLLVGKKQLQMRNVLHNESCLLLASLSGDHKYCPREALPKEYTQLNKLAAKVSIFENEKMKKTSKRGNTRGK